MRCVYVIFGCLGMGVDIDEGANGITFSCGYVLEGVGFGCGFEGV